MVVASFLGHLVDTVEHQGQGQHWRRISSYQRDGGASKRAGGEIPPSSM